MLALSRFTIVTGKGGVGKTSLAYSLTAYLSKNGKKAVTYNFDEENAQTRKTETKTEAPVEVRSLNLIQEVENYMAKKLRSRTIASWILKTPFFRAIFDMLPGFAYVIYLGSVLEDLKNDPDLYAILDSPSSGHAITMLEAVKNFSDIFGSGVLFEDLQKMKQMLNDLSFTQTLITTLPSEMAMSEAKDLAKELETLPSGKVSVILNQAICKTGINLESQEIPKIFKNRIETELAVRAQNQIDFEFPQVSSLNIKDITMHLADTLKGVQIR